jgi:hypothetical protein
VVERSGQTTTILLGQTITLTAPCGSGELATGGGYRIQTVGSQENLFILDSSAGSFNAGWEIQVRYGGPQASNLINAFAECASLLP